MTIGRIDLQHGSGLYRTFVTAVAGEVSKPISTILFPAQPIYLNFRFTAVFNGKGMRSRCMIDPCSAGKSTIIFHDNCKSILHADFAAPIINVLKAAGNIVGDGNIPMWGPYGCGHWDHLSKG